MRAASLRIAIDGAVLFAAGLFSMPSVAQQQLSEAQQLEVYKQAGKLRLEAHQRLDRMCGPGSETITVPDVVVPSAVDVLSGKTVDTTSLGSKQVTLGTLSWTGGCKDGVRDGEGTLTAFDEDSYPGIGLKRNEIVTTGLFVMGRRLGPWRFEKHSALPEFAGVYILHGFTQDGTGLYLKQADGSFRLAQYAPRASTRRFEPVETRGPITVDQVAARMSELRRQWEGAPGGVTPVAVAAPPMVIESSLLADLLQGRQAKFAAEQQLGDTRTKPLLIVLSNRTAASLDRMDDFGRVVGAWSGEQPEPIVRNASANLVKVVDKTAFVDGLTMKLRERFKSVSVADDLSVLAARPGSLALVFDFAFEHHMGPFFVDQRADAARSWDEITRRYKTPGEQVNTEPPLKVGVSYLVLNDRYEIVLAGSQNPQPISASRAHQSLIGDTADERATRGLVDAVENTAFVMSLWLSHAKQTRYGEHTALNNNVCDPMFKDIDRKRAP